MGSIPRRLLRPDNSTPMTASIGIAERTEDQAVDWKSLVDMADQRMYAAKQSGKQMCACLSSDSQWPDFNDVGYVCQVGLASHASNKGEILI